MYPKTTGADAATVPARGRDEPRGLDPDDPLVPGWEEFRAARSRFLAGLMAEAPGPRTGWLGDETGSHAAGSP